MKIKLTSIFVDDQDKALQFYTEKAGFIKKRDIPLGDNRWLTLVSPEDPNGTELALEPQGSPTINGALTNFKKSLFDNGIPFTAFAVDDIHKEYLRMRNSGVQFFMEPSQSGPVSQAIFDDSCGNLIQIYQLNPSPPTNPTT